MNLVRLAGVAVVFVALLLLALYNTEPVTLRFLNLYRFDSPLAFVVFTAFAVGVGCGLAAGAVRSSRLKRQLRGQKRDARGALREPAPHGALPGAAPAAGGHAPGRD
jgi:uncharacterized integral membrane protein